MKTQVTTRYLLSVAVSMIVLCAGARAGPGFFEDFRDGDPADGSPVNWVPVWGWDATGYTLTPEGLEVAGAGAGDLDSNPYIYSDVSIRVQIRRISNQRSGEWASGFAFRWSEGPTGGYWIEVKPPSRFWLGHRDRWRLRSATLPFNVDEQDLMIRVDALGDQIKGWCWPVGEPMPEDPQISIVDDVAPEGFVSLYAWTDGGKTIFRSVQVVTPDEPAVDLNCDGKVNCLDVCTMMQQWGTNDPLCDIAPAPFGDGIVDAQDLSVLAEHITDGGAPLAGDINCDGVVDFLDLAELAQNWLRQQP